MEQLDGRVAVITGGGSGIGEALAHACAAEGMRVLVADIEAGEAERVAAALRAAGRESLAARVDVTERESVDALADAAYAAFGAVHLLCNNAGVLTRSPIVDTPVADFEWNFAVNFYGVLHGVQAFAPRMMRQGGEAHIVNTASIGGLVPPAVHPSGAYTASKYAVMGLSETLRRELAPAGIGVSVLCPMGVQSRIFSSARNRAARFGGPDARDTDSNPAAERKDPAEVARRVIEGVRRGQFYIVTHTETRELVERRFGEILEACARLDGSS